MLTVITVFSVAVFSFLPPEETAKPAAQPAEPVQPAQTGPVIVDTSQVDAAVAQREAVYQDQIAQLDRALQERQATYQAQLEQLQAQLAPAQNQLEP
jgi:hypothetical protein